MTDMAKYMACICGWVSEPYPDDYMFMGLGGILDCPDCRANLRNATLEMCYGNVDVITSEELKGLREQEAHGIMWEQAFRNWQRNRLISEMKAWEQTSVTDCERTEDKLRTRKHKSIRNQGKYKGRGKEKRREP